MVVDINDTYGLYFHAKFYVYFANKLMRTHLAYLSYISAFQAGFCGLAGILYISLSTFRSIYEETVIFHKFQCLERPMAPQPGKRTIVVIFKLEAINFAWLYI